MDPYTPLAPYTRDTLQRMSEAERRNLGTAYGAYMQDLGYSRENSPNYDILKWEQHGTDMYYTVQPLGWSQSFVIVAPVPPEDHPDESIPEQTNTVPGSMAHDSLTRPFVPPIMSYDGDFPTMPDGSTVAMITGSANAGGQSISGHGNHPDLQAMMERIHQHLPDSINDPNITIDFVAITFEQTVPVIESSGLSDVPPPPYSR